MDNTKSNRGNPHPLHKRSVFGIPFFPLIILCISFSFMAGRAEARHGIHIPKHAIEGFITKCSENYTITGCSAMGEVYENSGKVSKALQIYRNHCMKNSDAHSCVLAAEVLKEHGRDSESLELYKKSCLLSKSVENCDRALNEYESQKDFRNEFRLNRTLCEINADGTDMSRYCYNTGKFYLGRKEMGRAEFFYHKGCSTGHTKEEMYGCIDQAVDLAKHGEFAISSVLFEMNCNKDNLYSCHRGIHIYREELKQPTKALLLAIRACDLQNPDGCYKTAVIYSEIGNDREKISSYFEKACKADFKDSCEKFEKYRTAEE